MFLIDTSVILPCLWKTTRHSHLQLLKDLSEDETPAISVITRFEVLAGTIKNFEEANRRFLNGFLQIEVGSEIADYAGTLFYEWSRKGHTLTADDLLIGASAQVHNWVLVTKNARHFPYLHRLEQRVIEYESRTRKKTREVVSLLH